MTDHTALPYHLRNVDAERIAARLVRGGFHPDAVDSDYYGVEINVRGVGMISIFETQDGLGPGAWTVQLYRYDQADPNRRYVNLGHPVEAHTITTDSLRGDLDLYILDIDPERIGQPDDE